MGQALVDALQQVNVGVADVLGDIEIPKSIKVLQSVQGTSGLRTASVAFRAPRSFARRLQAAHPTLEVAPRAWLYPQMVVPLGSDLAQFEIKVLPTDKGKTLTVKVQDSAGTPLAGISVRALLELSGTNVAATTGADGLASLRIPVRFDEIETVMVSPKHTYWSHVFPPMSRTSITSTPLVASLQETWPDTFAYLPSYVKADANAGSGVKVGVIDTGVGPHADLTIAGGLNCVVGEAVGDFLDNGLGHGTHVAGIIAGHANTGSGMLGLAPKCTLMSYRVCSASGEKFDKAQGPDMAKALERAIADECDLINISLGSPNEMSEVEPLLQAAREHGMVVFAAIGNDGQQRARYPAKYKDAVAVAALARDGAFPKWSSQALTGELARKGNEFVPEFSNHGIWTIFIGPGHAVVSTFPGDKYAVMSGTSMATPFVTGLTARLLSESDTVRTMPRTASRSAAILNLAVQAAKCIGFPEGFEGNGVIR